MITIEANYSKKIGLPGYSSHQFSVTLKSELSDVSKVEQESARLYDILQSSVDQNIQQVGFLPSEPKSNGVTRTAMATVITSPRMTSGPAPINSAS